MIGVKNTLVFEARLVPYSGRNLFRWGVCFTFDVTYAHASMRTLLVAMPFFGLPLGSRLHSFLGDSALDS